MKLGVKALASGTAATLAFPNHVHKLILSNAGSAVVYGLVNFLAADTEVAAANFHFLIPIAGNFHLDFGELPNQTIENVRLITASACSVGYVAN